MFEGPYTGFKSVLDMRTPRPVPAALGFYIMHVIVCIVFSALMSMIMGLMLRAMLHNIDQNLLLGMTMRVARLFDTLYATVLFVLIMTMRQVWRDPYYILGLVLTILLAMIGTAWIGIIPSAVALGLRNNGKRK